MYFSVTVHFINFFFSSMATLFTCLATHTALIKETLFLPLYLMAHQSIHAMERKLDTEYEYL